MRAPSPSRTLRTTVAVALSAAVALGAAACGPSPDGAASAGPATAPARTTPTGPFGELTGSQVVDKAMAATKAAKSLTMDVSMTTADGPLRAYMSVDTRKKCVGTVTMGTTGTAELVKADDQNAYLRFDEAFLRAESKGESPEVQEAVLKELKGRWTKLSVTDPEAADMVELCDLTELLASFDGGSDAVKGAVTTVAGRKALTLTERDGAETYTVHVATEGTPHLLKIAATGGEEPVSITFSGYDRPVTARVPAAKDVVTTD